MTRLQPDFSVTKSKENLLLNVKILRSTDSIENADIVDAVCFIEKSTQKKGACSLIKIKDVSIYCAISLHAIILARMYRLNHVQK